MKTLEQLWKENGEKPGLKVMHLLGNVFVLLGTSPRGDLYGHTLEGGAASVWADEWLKKHEWSLYQEPKPRRLAWICRKHIPGTRGILYAEGSLVFEIAAKEKAMPQEYWERAPWLDEPEDK